MATTPVVKSPVAKGLTQLVRLLNRYGRRYGGCGRDRWHGAVGDQGELRLKRSYQVTTSGAGLFGRGHAAHKCAVLRSRKRFDRVTVEVNAHDLGMVGVSVNRGVVVAYCRRREYGCVRVSELGVGEVSGRRWTIRLGGGADGLRRTARALQRLIRRMQRDPRHRRAQVDWRGLRRRGKIMRGVGIGVTLAGIAGAIVGGIFADRLWPREPCDRGGLFGDFGCGLDKAAAQLATIALLLPGIVATMTGVILWGTGQSWLDRARDLEMQAPFPKRSAAMPCHQRRRSPMPISTPATVSLGWTFRF